MHLSSVIARPASTKSCATEMAATRSCRSTRRTACTARLATSRTRPKTSSGSRLKGVKARSTPTCEPEWSAPSNRSNDMSLSGKTIFISGGSRGIGLAIALRAARDGANIALAAKTAEPHAKLEGTIHTAAEEINQAGGRALPLVVDIRDEKRVAEAVKETADTFGGIDILVNNASAIRTTGTLETPVSRYDLMHGVNGRGMFVCSQACLPHLLKAGNPHILTIAPPLTHEAKWFSQHPPYSIAKYTMSLFTLALAGEFAEH